MPPLDIARIRKDFPQLSEPDYHYLDSAATSLTPSVVLDAVLHYYTHNRANVHRGLFREAIEATRLYEEARKKVARFINADPKEIIFTSGATESSNMIASMMGEYARATEGKDEIVTTEMEHHGALLPLQEMAERKSFFVKHIPVSGTDLDYDAAERLISSKTAFASVILASNVTGTINDVWLLAEMVHKEKAKMIVDATAAIGHVLVDVRALGADALYFSGHKMFAPTGIGVLWVDKELLSKLRPVYFGGHMVAHVEKGKARWEGIPERFEAGTKNIAGAIGLGAAINYLEELGVSRIHEYVSELAAYAINILENIPGVRVYSEHDVRHNTGVVSFTCSWAHPHDVAEILARDRVAVRPGHHCAIPYHRALGVTATTRASLHVYNTRDDIDALASALEKARTLFS